MPLALSNSALMILEPMSIPSPVSVKCRYVIRIHVTKCDRTNRKPEFSEISWSQNLASTWSVLIAKYYQRWSRLLIRTKQTIIPFDEISGPIPRIWQCFTVLLRLMTILDIEDSLCSTLRLVGQFFITKPDIKTVKRFLLGWAHLRCPRWFPACWRRIRRGWLEER